MLAGRNDLKADCRANRSLTIGGEPMMDHAVSGWFSVLANDTQANCGQVGCGQADHEPIDYHQTTPDFVMVVGGSQQGINAVHLTWAAQGAGRIIAADQGALLCAQAGITPDLIVGDMDSCTQAELVRLEETGVMRLVGELSNFFGAHSIEKDMSDLDLALEAGLTWIRNRAPESDLVACRVLGGRLDHELAVIGSLERVAFELQAQGACRVFILEQASVGEIVLAGQVSRVFSQYGAANIALEGAVFSVMALQDETVVAIEGARWSGEHITLKRFDSRGISNIALSSTMVRVISGSALVYLWLHCDIKSRPAKDAAR